MKARKKVTAVDQQRPKGQIKKRLAENSNNELCGTSSVSNDSKTATKKSHTAVSKPCKSLSKTTSTVKKKLDRDKDSGASTIKSDVEVDSKSTNMSTDSQSTMKKVESKREFHSSEQSKPEDKETTLLPLPTTKGSSESIIPKDGKTKAISKMLKSLDIQISGFEEKIMDELKSSISENVKTKSRATVVKISPISNASIFSSTSATKSTICSKKDEKKINSTEIESDCKSKDFSVKKTNKTNEKRSRPSSIEKIALTSHSTPSSTESSAQEKVCKIDQKESHGEEYDEKEASCQPRKKIAENKKAKTDPNLKRKKSTKDSLHVESLGGKGIESEDKSLIDRKESDFSNNAKKISTKSKCSKMKIQKDESKVNCDDFEDTKPDAKASPSKTNVAVSKLKTQNKDTNPKNGSNKNADQKLASCQGVIKDEQMQQNVSTSSLGRRIINKGMAIRNRIQSKYKLIPIKAKKLKMNRKVKPKDGKNKASTEDQPLVAAEKNDVYDFKSGSESEENIKMELPILKNLREYSDDDDKPLKLNECEEKPSKQNVEIDDGAHKDHTIGESKKSTKKKCKTKTPISKVTTKNTTEIPASYKDLRKTVTKFKKVKIKKNDDVRPEDAVDDDDDDDSISSSSNSNSSSNDSDDEKKLIVFGQKRHRMASLNALAKVQCLYENESRTAYELGLSKTVQVIPKIRTLNSSGSEDEKAVDKVKKEQISNKNSKDLKSPKVEPKETIEGGGGGGDDSSSAIQIETKRELRKVPGRGMGKHWEFDSDSEENEDVLMIKLKLKKKKLQKLKNIQAAKRDRIKEQKMNSGTTVSKKKLKNIKKTTMKIMPQSSDGESESEISDDDDEKKISQSANCNKKNKKPKRELKEDIIGGVVNDYRGILARKRMASLNASAIVAATYEVERHLDMNLASDCDSFENEMMLAIEKNKSVSTRKAKLSSNKKNLAPTETIPASDVNCLATDHQKKDRSIDKKCKNTDNGQSEEGTESKLFKETKSSSSSSSSNSSSTAVDAMQKDSTSKECSRPTSSSVVIVQDTDVTITGVYVNSASGSGQEAYCKMQYRVQSSVTEERVLQPGSTEPPKSYTPLGALSSMQPPGSTGGSIPASLVDDNSPPAPPQTSSSSLPPESINSNMYQPNELLLHDISETGGPSYGYRGHHIAPLSPMHQYQHQYQMIDNPSAVSMHNYGHGLSASSVGGQYHSVQQQVECDPSSLAYQPNPNIYQISNAGSGGGASAFCAPVIQQQQQSHQHDIGGYYQPAGPLISPHVLQPTTVLSQSNVPHIATGSKKQIPSSLDSDSDQLQDPPQTISAGDSEILIAGGDLATFRYHSQQHSQGNLQLGQSRQHHQQQHQQHIHHQVAAGPGSPYPRSMHAPVHYTSAYPANYYAPYPGEAMCYSPPYQPYFPTKIYQSAPPPSAYRRYPPYYQQGLPPPSASDIYEQSGPPPVGHQIPPPPSSGSQIVPAGPPGHTQHLEHYPGPPGYYSSYNPSGSRCYTRSMQAPFMEYTPQCPCPMQQSCPKNVHTGPHIGSNTCNSNSNININNSPITTNNMNANISMATSTNNNNSNNNTIKSTTMMSSNTSSSDSRNNNNNNTLSNYSLINNNKNNNSNIPISYQSTSNSSSTNAKSSESLNTGRGPVQNITAYVRDNREKQQEKFTVISQPEHHHQQQQQQQHRLIQTCDIEILKPVKAEIQLDDLDDSKNSQYEEDVVHPLTPPLSFEPNSDKLKDKGIVPLELIEDADIVGEKESENFNVNLSCKLSSDKIAVNLEAYDLSSTKTAPVLIGRKARIGKSMAREMMYAGATINHQIRMLQAAQISAPQRVQQQLPEAPAQLSSSNLCSNNKNNNNNNGDTLTNDTTNHICANLHHTDVAGGGTILLKAEIKAEEIKKENDDVILVMPNVNHEIKNIKFEPEYGVNVTNSDKQERKSDDCIGYQESSKRIYSGGGGSGGVIQIPSECSSSCNNNEDPYQHEPVYAPGPKRIKILEVQNKTQCKRSPTNSYKNLIKQTQPKTYLCLSRKFNRRNRFGKIHKFKQCGVRKRHLILTDQQKQRLRMRKRNIGEGLQNVTRSKRSSLTIKKHNTNGTKLLLSKNNAQKNSIPKVMLATVAVDLSENSNDDNVTTRGYYSEPETLPMYVSSAVVGRKVKKSKTTSETRSKSETKRPAATAKNLLKTNSNLSSSSPLSPSTSMKLQNEQYTILINKGQTAKTTTATTLSKVRKNDDLENKNKTTNAAAKENKSKNKIKTSNINHKHHSSEAAVESLRSSTTQNNKTVDENKITNLNHVRTENDEINENNSTILLNMNKSKDAGGQTAATTSEAIIAIGTDEQEQVSQKQQQQQQQQLQHVFLQPLPPLPRIVCQQHSSTTKRTRSRSKFGCRKRQKLKHSVSFEVDETVPLTRTDVIPKWNNGWTWEGEAFQGAVFLNSDDPLVIRTCYPAMRHVEGDIIQTRDCVLLKANEDNELPYVAKVAHLWENPEDGEMMMSLLWYYRPEHTEQGRQPNDSLDEVYASRHRDHNSVACIEDKCFVLTFSEYCRYRRKLRASEEDIEDVSVVPKRPNYFNPRLLPDNINPELVMFCRRAYEFRTKRLLKMPNKQDYVVNS